jgi:hypothetical protein
VFQIQFFIFAFGEQFEDSVEVYMHFVEVDVSKFIKTLEGAGDFFFFFRSGIFVFGYDFFLDIMLECLESFELLVLCTSLEDEQCDLESEKDGDDERWQEES